MWVEGSSGAQTALREGKSVGMADHLRAVRKYWWIVLLALIASVGSSALLTSRITPQYASTVTFYITASTDTGTALQADEFAQRRINSYVGVLTSDLLAERIRTEGDIDLTAAQISNRISAVANAETILLTATVIDSSPERAQAISTAIADEFGPIVAELDSGGSGSSADVSLKVISGPTLEPDPVSPKKTLNLAVGVLVGLALGAALAIARQMADRTVRSVETLEQVTKLPVLASVAREAQTRRSKVPAIADPGSLRAEAYRKLRTNLMFSGVGKKLQVIVVTSSLGGEGKSTTAANLAIVLAETGRPVLLIEADMRRPMIAEYLGIEGGAGLTNVLAEQAEPDEVIQPWGTGGLHVLPCGTLPPNPSELIGSDTMRALVSDLRGRFDMIVIDTPPLLPVTDAAVASAQADGVVLVARYGSTSREQLATARNALRAVGAHVVGTVLNMVHTDGSPHESYHSYSAETPSRSGRRAATADRSEGTRRTSETPPVEDGPSATAAAPAAPAAAPETEALPASSPVLADGTPHAGQDVTVDAGEEVLVAQGRGAGHEVPAPREQSAAEVR